jgi:hypothetical protein
MSNRKMSTSDRAKVDAMFAKFEAEKLATQAAYVVTDAALAKLVPHLKDWSKGKPISKLNPSGSDTFWKCGQWMTQIQPKEVEALVAKGFAARTSQSVIVMAK